ncbi:MAG: SUMF1/EgtB/PvdO family nonheme iron enzyme [Chitinophagaceae bacterium]
MKKTGLLIVAFTASLLIQAQDKTDTAFKIYTQLIPGTSFSFKLVPIAAGSFTMGSVATEKGRDNDEGPQKQVTVDAFWMGAYEVTYEEYNAFFQDESYKQNADADAITRPSQPYIDFTLNMGKVGGFPANSMQQYGAIMYCRWLYKKTGIFFRLPTEAEWEYACRAGSDKTFFFGDNEADLSQYAWYAKNSGNKYHKVGELKPNPWGLYDILGNVGEWTMDQYDEHYFDSLQNNPTNPVIKPTKRYPRTVRGGTYKDDAKELRSANRLMSDPVWNRRDPQIPRSKWWNADAPFIGMRIIRPYKQPTQEEAETFFKLYLGK